MVKCVPAAAVPGAQIVLEPMSSYALERVSRLKATTTTVAPATTSVSTVRLAKMGFVPVRMRILIVMNTVSI
jgi:hypothetical protein